MIKAIQGDWPYGFRFFLSLLEFSCLMKHSTILNLNNNKITGLSDPTALRLGPWPMRASGVVTQAACPPIASLAEGRGDEQWTALLSQRLLWSVGSESDPEPDLPPQLSACWHPATWSLFKWTSCLFFLHIGFSSIWKQNSSPSACFWDHHNCAEDNWRQLNLRKTLLIRNSFNKRLCFIVLLNGACVPASSANAGLEINGRHRTRRESVKQCCHDPLFLRILCCQGTHWLAWTMSPNP